jgi:hypothetical protein
VDAATLQELRDRGFGNKAILEILGVIGLYTFLNYLTGRANVIWQGDEIKRYAGAERLLVFQFDRGYRLASGLAGLWSAPTFSPFLDK